MTGTRHRNKKDTSEDQIAHVNLWKQKGRQKTFLALGIPELQLAVDPLGWQFEKKFV